ncbi:MAG: hypothetical protein AAGB05_03000 [Pseudomonadota bacterium]
MPMTALFLRMIGTSLLAYILFILWMAAGLWSVLALTLVFNGGLTLAMQGDQPLETWPLLRRLRMRGATMRG